MFLVNLTACKKAQNWARHRLKHAKTNLDKRVLQSSDFQPNGPFHINAINNARSDNTIGMKGRNV